MSPTELDFDPYEPQYEFASTPKSRLYFSYLKHLRKAKERRKYQRKQKDR